MSDARPERGTRPANRRSLILETAAELFAERGYEHVNVSDIAEEVAVGPSALYRHFRGKAEILAEVLDSVFEEFAALLDAHRSGGDVLAAVAGFALDHRSFGTLWQREARHLPKDAYRVVRDRLREIRADFSTLVAGESSSIGAAAALSVMLGTSFYHVDLARAAYVNHLVALARRVLAVDVPPPLHLADTPVGRTRVSQRERLISSASRLFAERSYAAVSIEDLAADVGIAASSVYNHLPTKQDLLVIALRRADGYLQLKLDAILATTPEARAALRLLVAAYTDFAVNRPELVAGLVSETRNLPRAEARWILLAQRGYVDEWIHLLREIDPASSAVTARISVQSALMVCNDLSRTAALRRRADAKSVLTDLCCGLLAI